MASKYRKKFTMPEGFYKILEDYSREVIRDQPKDIVEFSYMYFKHLEEVTNLKQLMVIQSTYRAISMNSIIYIKELIYHLLK